MFEKLYSLPLQRAITWDELKEAHYAGRASEQAQHEFLKMLPIETSRVPPALIGAVLHQGSLTPRKVCPQTVEGQFITQAQYRWHMGNSVSPVLNGVVKQARVAMAQLSGEIRQQIVFVARRPLVAEAGRVVGGNYHRDNHLDAAARDGLLNIFCNVLDTAAVKAVGASPADDIGLEIVDAQGISHEKYDELDAHNFDPHPSLVGTVHRLKPNRFYIISNARFHRAGTLSWGRSQRLRDHRADKHKPWPRIGTLNIEMIYAELPKPERTPEDVAARRVLLEKNFPGLVK